MKHTLLLVLLAVSYQPIKCFVDKTLESYAVGEEVTDAVINKIRHSNIFPDDDHEFLKRLAFVHSKFGMASQNKVSFQGGIWQVNETIYNVTKETLPFLEPIHDQIYMKFGIMWVDTAWTDLAKPIYSGLATRMFLHVICYFGNNSLPGLPQTLKEQGNFWAKHFLNGSSLPDPSMFINEVKAQEEDTKLCEGKMDLIVVLDGSASVGEREFAKCKRFAWELFSSFSFASVRMAFIIFSGRAETVFPFGTNRSEMEGLIQNAEYPSNMTNTNAGIGEALRLFRVSDARPGVPKIMAVFTDGVSNQGGNEGRGGVPDIQQALQDNITVFSIGIGHYIDPGELLKIAYNRTLHVFQLTKFDALLEFFRRLNVVACTVPQTPGLEERTSDSLGERERRLYSFSLPPEGLLITVEVNQGLALGYYSYNFQNPSAVLNDGQLTAGDNFIPPFPKDRQVQSRRRKRRSLREDGIKNESRVFLAFVGMEERNEYSVEAFNGDMFHDRQSNSHWLLVVGIISAHILLAILAICVYSNFSRVWRKISQIQS